MFCTQCGSELPEGVTHCMVCGAPVRAVAGRRAAPAAEPAAAWPRREQEAPAAQAGLETAAKPPAPAPAGPEAAASATAQAGAAGGEENTEPADAAGTGPEGAAVRAETASGAQQPPVRPESSAYPPLRSTFVPSGQAGGGASVENAAYQQNVSGSRFRAGASGRAVQSGAVNPNGTAYQNGTAYRNGPAYQSGPAASNDAAVPDGPAAQPGLRGGQAYAGGPAYTPAGGAGPAPGQDQDPVGLGEWLLSELVLLVPVANLILLCIWSFGGGAKPSKRSWARARLILLATVAVIGVILAVVAVALLASGIMPLDDPYYSW